jgi:hypothetical protein
MAFFIIYSAIKYSLNKYMTNSRLSDEFKKLLVSEAGKARGAGTLITKGTMHERQKLTDIPKAKRDAVAHFWNAGHKFWQLEENKKYAITKNSPLPTSYQNLQKWKNNSKFNGNNDDGDQEVVETPKPAPKKVESPEDEEKRLLRGLLVNKYRKEVVAAQNELERVQSVLANNPDVTTKEDLDKLLEDK